MGFRFHRSIRLLPGIRLNFGKRGISASIGVRGAHVTFGAAGTRTTVGLPGSGLSYTHLEKPHHIVPIPTAAIAPTDPAVSRGPAARGAFWICLIVTALAVAIIRLAEPTPPPMAQIASQAAAPAVDGAKLAQSKAAVLGLAQIRRTLANSNTLQLFRVTAMPTGAICYQLHLKNRHGVAYVRTAVIDGTVLSSSGSDGFAALWNRHCAHKSDGRDITAEVKANLPLSRN
jgi:hypothetical protein